MVIIVVYRSALLRGLANWWWLSVSVSKSSGCRWCLCSVKDVSLCIQEDPKLLKATPQREGGEHGPYEKNVAGGK